MMADTLSFTAIGEHLVFMLLKTFTWYSCIFFLNNLENSNLIWNQIYILYQTQFSGSLTEKYVFLSSRLKFAYTFHDLN